MARRILIDRRQSTGDPSASITGSPASQTATSVRGDLAVTGTVSSSSPIEWVYSVDNGVNWTVFDPTGKVRDLVWVQDFFDDFTLAPDVADWEIYSGTGHLGNGVWDPAQVSVVGGALRLTGANDVTNGVKSGGLLLKREHTFSKFRISMRADLDPALVFRALAYFKSYDNIDFTEAVPGGEIRFVEMLAADAATRVVSARVHGNIDGSNNIITTVPYVGDDGEIWIEYTCERSPGRIDFYAGSAYAGSVSDVGTITQYSGEYSTVGGTVRIPGGAVFHGAGVNTAFNLMAGPFVFGGFQGGSGSCAGAYDTPASRAAGCLYQGGGVNSAGNTNSKGTTIQVWDPPSGGLVNLEDRYYALNGTLTAYAASLGRVAPADHWHQKLIRPTLVCAGDPQPPSPADILAATLPSIQEAVDAGMVVVPEIHDLTGDNRTPTGLYDGSLASFTAGDFKCAVEVMDGIVTNFKTDGTGAGAGSSGVNQGAVWLGDINEPWGNTAIGGCPPAAYFSTMTWWVKRIRLYHGAENIIVINLSEWGQDLHGLANGCYDAWWSSLASDASGDLSRNIVMSWHAYGAKAIGVAYDYAAMDADLNKVLRTGTPGGHTFPIMIGEYGRPKDGVSGNAGPSQWNINAFEYLMTSGHGQSLVMKYPELIPVMWHWTGDSSFWASQYAPTIGTGAANNDGLGQPAWQIVSGADSRLTVQGAAHWDISRQLWDHGTSTPTPKGPMHLALQLDPNTGTYAGSAINMEVGFAEVSTLHKEPVLVKARLVGNPAVSTGTATLTLEGAADQPAFTTDLPATTIRASGDFVEITAAWTPSVTWQVQQRANSSGTWANSSGTGSSGTGTSATFGLTVPAVDAAQYRVRLSSGGYYWYSTVTTLDVAADGLPIAHTSNTVTSNTSFITSHSFNLPATVAVNDILIAKCCFGTNAVTPGATITSDWTLAYSHDLHGFHSIRVYFRRCDGTEGGSAITFTTTSGAKSGAVVSRISNGYASGFAGTAYEVSSNTTGFGTSPDPAALTPVWGSSQTLWMAIQTSGGTGANVTAPATFTNLAQSAVAGGVVVASASLISEVASLDPGAFTLDDPTGENWAAVTIGIRPASATTAPLPPPVASTGYGWEDRPAYVEPNPNAAVGTVGKAKAVELGITSRVSVSTLAGLLSAAQAAVPGTQVYLTATITGNGTSNMIPWYSNAVGGGPTQPAGTNGALNGVLTGGGTYPDGTAANPIMLTCAPGVWIDGGLASGAEHTSSRCINLRGTKHVWLYGANFRRANFPVKYDQCPGDVLNPMRMWYCTVTESGHAAVHFGGYHTRTNNRVGESFGISAKYNVVSYAGLGQRRFGEAFYIGFGSNTFSDESMCHDIDISANLIHNCTAESNDIKNGCFRIKFNYNLIRDCNDGGQGTGGNQTEGFPGAVHFQAVHYTNTTLPAWYVADIEVIGNRWFRITSGSQKYPTALILVTYRGVKVVGNYFVGCSVPGSPQISLYTVVDGASGSRQGTFGSAGTIEIHNNTSKDARALWDINVAGNGTSLEKSTQQANANNNTNRSNNVGTSAQVGVDLVVSSTDFGNDGSGYEGAAGFPAVGGGLDVTGANTSAHWTTDFAGTAVAAPVNPGARQGGT